VNQQPETDEETAEEIDSQQQSNAAAKARVLFSMRYGMTEVMP
jgi:hypothetical protein